jgi:hypothetical protein
LLFVPWRSTSSAAQRRSDSLHELPASIAFGRRQLGLFVLPVHEEEMNLSRIRKLSEDHAIPAALPAGADDGEKRIFRVPPVPRMSGALSPRCMINTSSSLKSSSSSFNSAQRRVKTEDWTKTHFNRGQYIIF